MPAPALRRIVPRPVRRAASAYLARRNSARLQRELAAIVAQPGPVLAGPWLGEVGFELLYWVPFLAWFADRFDVAPERLMVLSRGGTESWYRSFASGYADVFDQVSPETFRDQHDARVREIGEQKQTRATRFERQLVDELARRRGTRGHALVHPSLMYELLNPFWWGHVSTAWVHRHSRYRRLPRPDATGVPALPPTYTAVKFYFNECFPSTPRNRALAADVVRRLAARGPVVVLTTGLNLDDHGADTSQHAGVHYLPESLDPARNLHVQSAIVAGATAFAGTYGGFAYLAPFYGVPSIVYYDDPSGFSARHLAMARSAFDAIGSGGLLSVCDAAAGPRALSAIEPRRA